MTMVRADHSHAMSCHCIICYTGGVSIHITYYKWFSWWVLMSLHHLLHWGSLHTHNIQVIFLMNPQKCDVCHIYTIKEEGMSYLCSHSQHHSRVFLCRVSSGCVWVSFIHRRHINIGVARPVGTKLPMLHVTCLLTCWGYLYIWAEFAELLWTQGSDTPVYSLLPPTLYWHQSRDVMDCNRHQHRNMDTK